MKHERDGRFGSVQHDVLIPTESGITYQIPVTFHIIPHRKQRREPSRSNQAEKGYLKANDMQGVYYYRNQRLIKYGGWEGLFGETNDEHGKLGKIEIDVPGPLYRHFGLDPNKTGFDLPGDFAMRLQRMLMKIDSGGKSRKAKKSLSPQQPYTEWLTRVKRQKILQGRWRKLRTQQLPIGKRMARKRWPYGQCSCCCNKKEARTEAKAGRGEHRRTRD